MLHKYVNIDARHSLITDRHCDRSIVCLTHFNNTFQNVHPISELQLDTYNLVMIIVARRCPASVICFPTSINTYLFVKMQYAFHANQMRLCIYHSPYIGCHRSMCCLKYHIDDEM